MKNKNKIIFGMIFLFAMLLISVQSASAWSSTTLNNGSYCYQETATTTTSCGGLSTGSYSYTGNWTNPTNMYDGDWNTYAQMGIDADNISEYYVNYSIPLNAKSDSIWQTRVESVASSHLTANYTIPIECFVQPKLQLKIVVTGIENSNFKGYCLTGITWKQLSSVGGVLNGRIEEEAMYWHTASASGTEKTTENLTFAPTDLGYSYYQDYQENANFTNSSGMGWFDGGNFYDGNWNTYGRCTGLNSCQYYVNYTKPTYFLNMSWQIKFGDVSNTYYENFTIPQSCWNTSSNVTLYINFSGAFNYMDLWCLSNSGWIFFYENTTHSPRMYEEAVYWNSKIPTQTSLCYQESADVVNQKGTDGNCALFYNGDYSTNLSWWDNFSLFRDGNWSSYMNRAGSDDTYIWINYTKPAGAIGGIHQFKWGAVAPYDYINTTISNSCWNANDTQIQLRLNQNFFASNEYVHCWNGTSWDLIGTTPVVNGRQYDEAMFWNVTPSNSKTRYLIIPDSVRWVTNAFVNLSGYSIGSPFLRVGDRMVWAKQGIYSSTEKTTNFASIVSNDLTSTYLSENNYIIPFDFNSYGAGSIFYFASDTFNNWGFTENYQTYNTQTIEGASETFSMNTNYDTAYYPTVVPNLVYDGTSYLGVASGSGTNITFAVTIAVPTVNTTSNKTFYWNLKMVNTTGSIEYYNSTSYNQSILNLAFDDCSVYTNMIYNMTLYDEELKTKLTPNPATMNTTIQATLTLSSLGTTNNIMNTSHNWNNTNPAKICLNINLSNISYRADLLVSYQADGYVEEFYYMDNGVLSNTTNSKIYLYDLKTTDSTSFLVTYQDENYLYIGDAVIDVWRKYIGTNEFISVEHGKTDAGGQTRLHLVTEDVIYKFLVWKNGVLLYTSPEYLALCQATPCQINLRKPFNEGEDLSIYNNIAYSFNMNKTSRTVTMTFATTDGSSTTMAMNVTAVADEEITICSDTSTTSGGTLVCVIPQNAENTTYMAQVTRDGAFFGLTSFALSPTAPEIFGNTGLILSALAFLTLALMGISSGIATIVLGIVGLIFASLLMIFEGGSVIGIGSALIWLIIAGIIIIYKISHRRVS